MDTSRLVKVGLILCVFGLVCAARVSAAAEPLQTIFYDLSGAKTQEDVWEGAAKGQSTGEPYYSSEKEEERDFEGFFVPATEDTELWVFSDDGVDVYVTDYTLPTPQRAPGLQQKNQPQHLPNWKKESLRQVILPFPLRANNVYRVEVNYSNIIYLTDRIDIDGCTLFAIKGGGQVLPVSVTFDPDTVKTGFTLPKAESTIARSVTATVLPKEATNHIDISRDGPTAPEVVIQNLEKHAETGKITFRVKGVEGTPEYFREGRTTIRAKYAGEVVGEVKAIVYVPTLIHTPHPEADGDVTPVNFCADNGTSPTWAFGLFPTQCALITHWSHLMTITVDDQWGNTLDEIYEGVHIKELFGEDWWDISLRLSDKGTYDDPVGFAVWPPDNIVLKTSEAAQNWPPPPPPPTLPMGIPGPTVIEHRIWAMVGGHRVGQVKRDVTATPPNHIKIVDAK